MFPSRKAKLLGLGLVLTAAIVGCAAGAQSSFATNPAGFWAGLWHGLICWITFIVSLFTSRIGMYEVNNAGRLYDLGFLLGATAMLLSFPICSAFRRAWVMPKGGAGGVPELEDLIRKGIETWARRSGYTGEESESVTKRIHRKVAEELKDWEKSR